jgi:endonuclease/exonuclease/phosphatase family metal-dependent hydrolase
MHGLRLKVVTFNCLFRGNTRARLARTAAELDRSDADVVCLQEVVWRGNVRLLRTLTRSYPFTAVVTSGVGILGGLVTLSRWPIEHQRYQVYRQRGQMLTIALADWVLRKGFLRTTLRIEGQPLVVVNTHLLANYDEDWSPENRYARQLRSELAQLADHILALESTAPVIVAGDLNTPSDSPFFAEFIRNAGLHYVPCGPTAPGAEYAIDYVLVRPPAAMRVEMSTQVRFDTEVILADGRRSRLSDHNGVEATISLTAAC